VTAREAKSIERRHGGHPLLEAQRELKWLDKK